MADLPAGNPYGAHRVLSPAGALPQSAERLDADPAKRFRDELHIEVETLNVDSASMRQLEEEEGGDPVRVGRRIAELVAERGKLQNPVTGSGGMLLGRVSYVGADVAARFAVAPGDKVATLVSLTLTPLTLRRVLEVRLDTHQVTVEGTAILFASGMLARLPPELDERLVLAALDVAGAAPQVSRLAAPGSSVLVLGCGGKSGLLCAAAARRKVGQGGVVVGVERHASSAEAARRLGHCQVVVDADASDPLGTVDRVLAAAPPSVRNAGGFDLVVSCVNVPSAEMAAILTTRPRGQVYFFSMATSFARAALGAEGVSRDVDMLVGNGYCEGHAAATLALLRDEPALCAELERRLG